MLPGSTAATKTLMRGTGRPASTAPIATAASGAASSGHAASSAAAPHSDGSHLEPAVVAGTAPIPESPPLQLLQEGFVPSKALPLQLLEQGHVVEAEGQVFTNYMERGMELEEDFEQAD